MSKVKEVLVPFTENDIQELQSGGEHHWNFGGVEMRIYNVDALNEVCPRCIEDYEDEETGEQMDGEEKPSHCPECFVCEDCEHMSDCKYSE